MKNKLKQELRDKLLSDHNTEANVNIAFDVCKDFSIGFISFLREKRINKEDFRSRNRNNIL